MRCLKQHADGLLDSILNHPNLTEPQIYQMDAAQKEELRRRVQIADDVSHMHLILVCVDICVQCVLSVTSLASVCTQLQMLSCLAYGCMQKA